jgi:hypothetical protein
MDAVQRWCRVTVTRDGAAVVDTVLAGRGNPDLAAVERLARLALLAGRVGGVLDLAEVAPAFRELLELTGLGFLAGRLGSGGDAVEVEREAEGGEDPLEIRERQEVAQPGDLAP